MACRLHDSRLRSKTSRSERLESRWRRKAPVGRHRRIFCHCIVLAVVLAYAELVPKTKANPCPELATCDFLLSVRVLGNVAFPHVRLRDHPVQPRAPAAGELPGQVSER